MTKCFDSDPHVILTKYITDHQEHTNIDTDKDRYKLIKQGVKTTNDRYYNTHHKSILSNTVTESDIYNNYSYTSCVNCEIKNTPKTPLKKLEFNIDKPGTSLKKIDFNIITNNNEINNMNDNKMVCHSNNLTNNVYSNISYKNVQQERTTHNSLYRLVNSELQMNYDLENLYGTDDWMSTISHKGELVIVYNNKDKNKTLRPRIFYALYIKLSDNDNRHLLYRLFTDQILVTKEYQSVPSPEELIEAISKPDLYDNKIQFNHFDSDHSIVRDDHSNNHNKNGHTPINNKNNS